MKRTFYFLLMLSVLAFSSGCKKDETEEVKPAFSAKVDGTLFTGVYLMAQHSTGGDATTITGAGAMPSEQIVLNFKGSGVGTFDMSDNNIASVVVGGLTCTTLWDDTPSGSVVITKYDVENKKISGTFSFSASDFDGGIHQITEGKFENLELQVY